MSPALPLDQNVTLNKSLLLPGLSFLHWTMIGSEKMVTDVGGSELLRSNSGRTDRSRSVHG